MTSGSPTPTACSPVLVRHRSANGAQVLFPGAEGGYGRAVDGLEGFARTLPARRVPHRRRARRRTSTSSSSSACAASPPASIPTRQDRWVRLDGARAGQGRGGIHRPDPRPDPPLDLGPPRRRHPAARDRRTSRRSSATTATRRPTGSGSASSCRRSCARSAARGRPTTSTADLAPHDSFLRADGWISDGAERSYDHYVGWALHLYPVLWSRMPGAAELADGPRPRPTSPVSTGSSQDALALVGADGSPLLQGRSLIYRFAAAAPFWAGVIAERAVVVRRCCCGTRRTASSAHFADARRARRARRAHDRLARRVARGSPSRTPVPARRTGPSKGLLGVALPADHPVWTAPSEPLPVETADALRVDRRARPGSSPAPGPTASSASSTTAPTTPSRARRRRLARSTRASATRPRRARCSTRPRGATRSTSRSSWSTPTAAPRTAPACALPRRTSTPTGSGSPARPGRRTGSTPTPTAHRHGGGLPGTPGACGSTSRCSLVRGPWEVRLVRVDGLAAGAAATGIRVGGWPIAGDDPETQLDERWRHGRQRTPDQRHQDAAGRRRGARRAPSRTRSPLGAPPASRCSTSRSPSAAGSPCS